MIMSMTPAEWARVKAAFAALHELPRSEQAAALALARAQAQPQEGGLDLPPDLLDEVEALLGADAAAGSFLFAGAPGEAGEDSEAVPARIGPYEVLRLLGRGGMGAVYLAAGAGDDPFQRRVAIKVIAPGAAPEAAQVLMRRFSTERQVLGALAHPNIARLLGAGTWEREDGPRPYLVMEYVDGVPIDAYCQRQRLSIEARLRLFQKVCAAVHHAHERLVLHRDLKPSNILVDRGGAPKLLDFGIARPLHPSLLPADQTATLGGAPCTPEYASPEQVRGEPLDRTSDVYALGVLLFRLLTDARPYGARAALCRGPIEVARLLCDEEVGRPSAAAPPSRQAALRGDIDRIVIMATRKEPGARYPSAWALWEDIERYWRGLPLRARPRTIGYVTGKFVRRNRVPLAAVALCLLAGSAATLSQARVARRHQAEAARREAELRGLREAMRAQERARAALAPAPQEAAPQEPPAARQQEPAPPEPPLDAPAQPLDAPAQPLDAPWEPQRRPLVVQQTRTGLVPIDPALVQHLLSDRSLILRTTPRGAVPVSMDEIRAGRMRVLKPLVVRRVPQGYIALAPMMVGP
jgi:hypothetical protein